MAAVRGLIGLALMLTLSRLHGSWAFTAVALGVGFTLPGVLALRALRIPSAAVRAFPLYVPAASTLVIMLGGLAADLLGPHLGISRPLRGSTPGIAVTALSLILLLAGVNAPDAACFPWRRMLSAPSLVAPLALPALAACGALLLNNGHGPVLARVSAALVLAFFVAGLVMSSRLTWPQIATLIFASALAAEWASSLRSAYVVGFDISTEIHLAQGMRVSGIWHANNPGNAYGAMLSLTVFPTTLSAMTGCSTLFAFKAVYPVLTALIPVSVYLVASRYTTRSFAMGAAGLLLVQSYFFEGMPQLARQEVGLLFFAVLVAGFLDRFLSIRTRIWVVGLATLGLVLSHYSSAYFAIGIFTAAAGIQLVLLAVRRTRVLSISLLASAVLLAGTSALWYGPITHSSSNLAQFVSSVRQNGLQLLPTQGQHQGAIGAYLGGNVVTAVSAQRYEALAVRAQRTLRYIRPLAAGRKPEYRLQAARVPAATVRSQLGATFLNDAVTAVGELMLVLAFLGAVAMTLRRSAAALERQLGIVSLACITGLVVIRFSGTVAQAYNQQRALLQALIVLAIPAAWTVKWIGDRARRVRPVVAAVAGAALGIVFVSNLGLGALIVGGGTSLNLSQGGEDFERLYVTRPELAAATWANSAAQKDLLYADRYGQLRLFQTSGRVAFTAVTPETLDRDAWIYGTRANVLLGRARGQVGSYNATYSWPKQFIDKYYNTVFSDGTSEVFH